MKFIFLKIGLLCAAVVGIAESAQALEGGVVIANESVSAASLSADQLKDIYTGKTTYWEGGQAVVIIVLPGKTDAAMKEASGMDASQFKTFWQRLAFSGRGKEPKKADDAASLISMVTSTKGAIAVAPADAELKGVKKIEVK